MSTSHLLFFRLRQGKVWHVACGGATVALCTEPLPDRGERQPKRPPYGGRPCPSCSVVATELGLAMDSAVAAMARQSVDAALQAAAAVSDPWPLPVPDSDYEQDLTDPEGVLSNEVYAERQAIEQARIEAETYRERRGGKGGSHVPGI